MNVEIMVTVLPFPCNRVQNHLFRPLLSYLIAITLRFLSGDSTTHVTSGWYSRLCSNALVLHAKFECNSKSFVLEPNVSYLGTLDKYNSISYYTYISVTFCFN